MQRRSSGFLRADENEIEPLDFATLGSKHRYNLHGERCTGKLSAPLQACYPYACALSSAYVESVSHLFFQFHFRFGSRNEYIRCC